MSAIGKLLGSLLIYSILFPLLSCETLDDGCGPSFLGSESGVLSSKRYPDTYPNNSQCEWKIRVAKGNSGIVFRFGDLDIEASLCESSYVRVFPGHHGDGSVYDTFCGQPKSPPSKLYANSTEVTVQFRSGTHISGRGFLLSYAAVEHEDLITCLDTGSRFPTLKYRKYCPAGCKAEPGDVSGDISQGYRHTSVLCKSAIHAGVITNELGGQIYVEARMGLSHYPGTRANGIQSKAGSLSDTLFTFNSSACKNQMNLQPVSRNASSWLNIAGMDEETGSPGAGSLWLADNSSAKHWLYLDLGEKKKVTEIITAGSAQLGWFVRTYRVEHRERNRWKSYTQNNGSKDVDVVFEGDEDGHPSRNTFHPPLVTRYLRIIPLSWHRQVAMTVELHGCPYVKANSSEPETLKPRSKASGEAADLGACSWPVCWDVHATTTGPDVTHPLSGSVPAVKLLIITVPTVLCVLILFVVFCSCKMLHRKKAKDKGYGSSNDKKSGCWKQIKQPFVRHPSGEFTISYSPEKEPMQKLDLITSAMAVEYQQPPMIGMDTVTRKGSTFRPMDNDVKEESGDAVTHYDYLHTVNQYALPLTNPEPEYATPIIERHTFRKDGFLPDPSYSVPGTVLSKTPSFTAGSHGTGRGDGAYQMPQVKAERLSSPEGVYDKPKVGSSPLPNGIRSDYQRPQAKPLLAKSYSTQRDCVKRADPVARGPEQAGTTGGT
uniref:Discoidin, CUB and LCCL domain containing 1 n=1 Tax=Paramormyrops kingsleyae TaxID=1676925 RepID=A0A3B3SYD3_9TELE|nr:discoidin, CUB and LCCL domain-containing protein 1 isoform X1 [Paramormyrops kingsleyae]